MNYEGTNKLKAQDERLAAVAAGATGYALLWIHSHHQTREPLQIDVVEWNGRVDVLEQLTDDSKIGELDLANLPREDWIHVRVEYEWEDTSYSLRLFQHNNPVSDDAKRHSL